MMKQQLLIGLFNKKRQFRYKTFYTAEGEERIFPEYVFKKSQLKNSLI